jgi:DNA-binding NtrC family response regulator
MKSHARHIGLVVEDDADLRALMASLMEEARLQALECESAEAALAMMLTRGPEIALDIRLSGAMDGVDLAREIKVRWPHLPIILTSGNAGNRLAHLPHGIIYMPKPWRELEIRKIVEDANSLSNQRSIYGR